MLFKRKEAKPPGLLKLVRGSAQKPPAVIESLPLPPQLAQLGIPSTNIREGGGGKHVGANWVAGR